MRWSESTIMIFRIDLNYVNILRMIFCYASYYNTLFKQVRSTHIHSFSVHNVVQYVKNKTEHFEKPLVDPPCLAGKIYSHPLIFRTQFCTVCQEQNGAF